MKKILVLFTVICFPILSHGQFSVGISTGSNISTMSINLRDLSTFKINPIFGYNANLIVEYNLNPALSIWTGLSISQKGFNHHMNFRYSPNSDSTADMTSKLTYLELPVYLKFNTNFKRINVFYGIGPYFSYGLQGKITTNISGRNDLTITDKINWDKPRDYLKSDLVKEYGYNDIKRLDIGVTAILGLKYNSFMVTASYKYGLNNIMWEYYQDEKMSNSSLSLSVGYFFIKPTATKQK
jgi:hypothetical protein